MQSYKINNIIEFVFQIKYYRNKKGGVQMTKVDVKPELLIWAASRAGGVEYIQKKIPNIAKWIKLDSKPTIKQLEKLAKTTSTPLGYFFLHEPPQEELTVPNYRTLDSNNPDKVSVELVDTIKTMEIRQDWMRDYLIDNGHDPLPYVGSANLNDDPVLVAKNIRKTLSLENGWATKHTSWTEALRHLIYLLEDIGILVMANGVVGNNTHRALDVNEFRGFVLIDKYAPLVFLNSKDGKAAQMFTLAHEIAHIWFGASGIFDLKELQPSSEKLEQICNQVAAEFLIPTLDMKNAWKEVKYEPNKYQLIARKFKVSELVVVRRALDLKLISLKDYRDFYKERETEEVNANKKRRSGGDYYNNQNFRVGKRFGEAVINSTLEGKTLYRDAYQLTGLKRKTFNEFAKRQKGGR